MYHGLPGRTIIFILCLFLVITGVVAWVGYLGSFSIEAIEGYANIKLQKGSKVRSIERLADGREVRFVVSISLPEGGKKFCRDSQLKNKKLMFEPLSPREKGYNLLLGKPGICFGEKGKRKAG